MSIPIRPYPGIEDPDALEYMQKIYNAFQTAFEFPNRTRVRSAGNMSGVYEDTYIPKGENYMMVGPVSLSANLSCAGNLQVI